MSPKVTITATIGAIVIAALVALSGASNSESFGGIQIFVWCAIISFRYFHRSFTGLQIYSPYVDDRGMGSSIRDLLVHTC